MEGIYRISFMYNSSLSKVWVIMKEGYFGIGYGGKKMFCVSYSIQFYIRLYKN